MSNLINFNFESIPVRVIEQQGETWFVASDICRILLISNPTEALKALDDDEKSKLSLGDEKLSPKFNLGLEGENFDSRVKELNLVNESGLYVLIMRSRKATQQGTIQHKFRKWVTSEVLPSIRKTGSYGEPKAQTRITPQTLTELAPITPFKSHLSASDFKEHTTEGEKLVQVLHPLIEQLADCYYDKSVAYEQIKKTIAHYCGIKNFHWITLERIPTALTVLSIIKNEATAHKKMMHRLDDNARLALSYKTVNAIGYTGETFDSVEV